MILWGGGNAAPSFLFHSLIPDAYPQAPRNPVRFAGLPVYVSARPGPDKPFLATPAAIALYREQIHHCRTKLQELARQHQGIDYLQVFNDSEKAEALWFIEDDTGGAITALLPSDY